VAERRVERRRNARVPALGDVIGSIHAIKAAPILNISERGILIESPAVLRPGALYTIQLGLEKAKPVPDEIADTLKRTVQSMKGSEEEF
jgi:hypothetical protein